VSYINYALPLADTFRHFDMTMDEATPSINNPLGVKGVGELGTIGATPAVVNAVLDAIARNGAGTRADALQMPLTAERVWRALSAR
jgi:carbon-monoxide dehydrogenase large subunit